MYLWREQELVRMEADCAAGQPVQHVAFVKLETKVLYSLYQKKRTLLILRHRFAFCVLVLFGRAFSFDTSMVKIVQ